MDLKNLSQPFSNEQKINSFLYLQKYILQQFELNEPFFIGRLSGNETNLSGKAFLKQPIDKIQIYEMLTGAGIQFSDQNDIKQFVQQYTNACLNCSIMAIWSDSMYLQGKNFYDFLLKILPNQKQICAQALEPYYFMNHPEYNFNTIFKNKKILIITSHKESICQQLKKKIFNKSIFDNSSNFYIYKAPQQNAGNHDSNNWIFHYEKMCNDLNVINKEFNFDIALVSCGGFGMIISNHIFNEFKKSTIYVGGALQLYFGIKGNRWNSHPIISKMINDKWINVVDEDKPNTLTNNPNICENNCYW